LKSILVTWKNKFNIEPYGFDLKGDFLFYFLCTNLKGGGGRVEISSNFSIAPSGITASTPTQCIFIPQYNQ
jgi:hypothetical protein